MARKAAVKAKATGTEVTKPKSRRSAAPKTAADVPAAAPAKRRVPRKAPSVVETLTAPVAEASTKARKALKATKAEAARLIPDVPAPSMPDMSASVTDAVKSIGSQIVGALNTDVGRVMVAELLVYMAKSLTSAAAKTETAEDAKSALLNAGAKIGAAAADAGAKLVETGNAAASAGAQFLDEGQAAAKAGVEAVGETAGNASNLVRDVAQVAVGAVGGAASKILKRKRGSNPLSDAAADPGPHRQL